MNANSIVRAIGFVSENVRIDHIFEGPNERILFFGTYNLGDSSGFKCVYIFNSDGNYLFSPELSMFQQKRDFFLGLTDKW
jgi:hypothetical protein